jgi:oxidoreductase AflX
MPTYALLGATGSTGSAIFVRSRSKLYKTFPELESTTAFKINIIQGVSGDAIAMQECLKDVDVVMACIGSNYSTQGMSLIYDTATAIINALEIHRKTRDSAYKPPTIIQLRSATLNPIWKAASPWLARTFIYFCFQYAYEDLDRACKLFASSAADSPGLLHYIFIDPPSIHDADGTTPTGYKLIHDADGRTPTGYKLNLDEKQDPVLSYADLGAAFCEVAEQRDKFAGKAVGVTATGIVNQTWGTLIGYMATGVKGRIWG